MTDTMIAPFYASQPIVMNFHLHHDVIEVNLFDNAQKTTGVSAFAQIHAGDLISDPNHPFLVFDALGFARYDFTEDSSPPIWQVKPATQFSDQHFHQAPDAVQTSDLTSRCAWISWTWNGVNTAGSGTSIQYNLATLVAFQIPN
jgi:hypothetical protein